MADIQVETYQLCYGNGVGAPTVLVAQGIRDRRTADKLRNDFDALASAGGLDPAVYPAAPGLTFYVRVTPGVQVAVISGATFEQMATELGPGVTLPLFAKVTGAGDIRCIELSIGRLAKLRAEAGP
jgi:hypothetical protein